MAYVRKVAWIIQFAMDLHRGSEWIIVQEAGTCWRASGSDPGRWEKQIHRIVAPG